MGKLSALKIKTITQPGRYGDGAGLWLQVARGGTRSWLLRYQLDGRPRQMGLGPYPLVSLAEARERATAARRLLLDRVDPLEDRDRQRRQQAVERAKLVTFRWCADSYIAAHEAGWRNAVHRRQWRQTLEDYAHPLLGELPVADIDTPLVMRVLEPLWLEKPETASRLRGRIEVVLSWARVRGHRQGENPARWRGHLDQLLPKKSSLATVAHHPALPWPELPAFMAQLRQRRGLAARALELAILTAPRTREVLGARWSEIDIKRRLWTVPAERMKWKRDHRVPLAPAAVALLEALPRVVGEDWVFPGTRPGKPLSNMSMAMVLRRMDRGDITPHGFRSTFRDWCAEKANAPREVAEAALAHAEGSRTEKAYQRGDMLDRRRKLMVRWAEYCLST